MVMDLPEITEVQRFRYLPGDRFVVKVPGTVSQQMASEIVRQLRYALDLPDGTPVVILADGWGLTITGPADDETPGDTDALPGWERRFLEEQIAAEREGQR